jgi:hypothetical protein
MGMKYKTGYTLIILLGFLTSAMAQQTGEKENVVAVVKTLFKAMEKGDSALLHTAFRDDVTLVTVFRDKSKNPVLQHDGSVNDFLKAVGTPHPDVWYEEIWNVNVQIDGDLAQVWCDYAFYLGNKFSHCGVDAFHLHKGKDGWKIFHLADTRRKEGCEVPEDIKKKHQP